MGRITLAFSAFFRILFSGALSDALAARLGLVRRAAGRPPAPAASAATPADGALQVLSILQRDSRLVDFLMEDLSGYADDQVAAVVRPLHTQCREALGRVVKIEAVIDGVEGVYTKPGALEPPAVRWVGNVPAGKPVGGVLRHRGWRATRTVLPPLGSKADTSILAPAELEVE